MIFYERWYLKKHMNDMMEEMNDMMEEYCPRAQLGERASPREIKKSFIYDKDT